MRDATSQEDIWHFYICNLVLEHTDLAAFLLDRPNMAAVCSTVLYDSFLLEHSLLLLHGWLVTPLTY